MHDPGPLIPCTAVLVRRLVLASRLTLSEVRTGPVGLVEM